MTNPPTPPPSVQGSDANERIRCLTQEDIRHAEGRGMKVEHGPDGITARWPIEGRDFWYDESPAEPSEVVATLAALLRYSGDFYGVAIERGIPASVAANAVAHIEKAARRLAELATPPAAPSLSVEELEALEYCESLGYTVSSVGHNLHLVCAALRRLMRESPQSPVDDLAALVGRLVHALRKAAPQHTLPDQAVDYLRRQGLQGSPLRQPLQAAPAPVESVLTRAQLLEEGIRGMMHRAKERGDEYTESYLEGCLESADELTGKPAESAGAVACVTISHFREAPQMENRDFDYYGNLPPGTYSLYTHPAPAGSDVTEAYKAVALMTGMDEYGPRLEWRSHWADHNGKTLYVKAANAARGEKGL